MHMRKICFTIMGFGKKTDYSTGKTYDLDKTYHGIIKPVVERCGYISIRADEIQDSGLIDKSMYALLISRLVKNHILATNLAIRSLYLVLNQSCSTKYRSDWLQKRVFHQPVNAS
ncbi:hypothetical protein [Methylomonas sp. DH-1]|uniref:hypothetical protein n=1 Tax=Methylomonas sp. (strain DH-1) TaxID=1727196 RepID=UPI0007C97624|nr:hypothetical protein [Methylomonas sp. DH-1]ANE56669.1 hypothetical protein AYM39_16780 [Methylomonas sp. DH-1]